MKHEFVDCHCHVVPAWLQDDAFGLRGVLKRCASCGVRTVVVCLYVSTDGPEFDLNQLRRVFDGSGVRLCVTLGFPAPVDQGGLASVGRNPASIIDNVRRLSDAEEVLAIGEVGLDYYWPRALLESEDTGAGRPTPGTADAETWIRDCHAAQRKVFRSWIELARELGLPVVVHDRQAHADALSVLDESGIPPHRVMFHCFGAGPSEAVAAAERGYWISLPSSVWYRAGYQEVASAAPLERLLTETDSPYHSPVLGMWKQAVETASAGVGTEKLNKYRQTDAYRENRDRLFGEFVEHSFPGLSFDVRTEDCVRTAPSPEYFRRSAHRNTNEPTFVRAAAEKIAEIKGIDLREAAATLAANARGFYRLT